MLRKKRKKYFSPAVLFAVAVVVVLICFFFHRNGFALTFVREGFWNWQWPVFISRIDLKKNYKVKKAVIRITQIVWPNCDDDMHQFVVLVLI